MIVTKDAIRNTNQAPIFEDSLQPAPMPEGNSVGPKGGQTKIMGLIGRMKIEK